MRIAKFFILLLLISASCSNQSTENSNNKKTITVSILPQKYFVEKVAGEHFNINVLIPPGASPVTYEPTPKQMKELSNSFAYLKIGYIEFENVWMKNMQSINAEMKIVDLSQNADLIEPENKHVHSHDGHHHHGVDPHIWTSPIEVKKQAEIIFDFLVNSEPESKNEFTVNYNSFLSEIDSLNNYLIEILLPYKNRKFMIFHPALSYIARDYGLEQISIEIDGKEPTPANIQEIINVAKQEDIRIIFVQKQFSTHNAEVIANEIQASVIQIDPLDYNWEKSIRFIANEIVKSYSKAN
ncbi:MAG: zinc ABC transporter substrate-binding protein [Bacteroidales bacterium]|nr:zinc ABC transporter substrate-binding protein [Bacteroidales bacterium]